MNCFESEAFAAAQAEIRAGRAGLLVLQDGQIVFRSDSAGIRAALQLHDRQPQLLRGACVVDRIIGRASALVFADGGAAAVYGQVMSRAAQAELQARGIACRAGELVDGIVNRQGTGMCPMEQAVLNITQPEPALAALRQTVARLMAAQAEKGAADAHAAGKPV